MNSLLENIHNLIRWVNDFWLKNEFSTITYSVMSPEEQIEFTEELKELVADKIILQSDMDIMLKNGDEIRTAIENLFLEKKASDWTRKEFLRKLILLLKSHDLSDKYIHYICVRLYPYLQ